MLSRRKTAHFSQHSLRLPPNPLRIPSTFSAESPCCSRDPWRCPSCRRWRTCGGDRRRQARTSGARSSGGETLQATNFFSWLQKKTPPGGWVWKIPLKSVTPIKVIHDRFTTWRARPFLAWATGEAAKGTSAKRVLEGVCKSGCKYF